MSYVGGILTGCATVFLVLVPVTTKLIRAYPGRPGMRDWPVAIAIGLMWVVVVTLVGDRLWPDRGRWFDGILVGIAIAPVPFCVDIATALRHRRGKATEAVWPVWTEPRTERRFIVPARFSEEVQNHFADPMVRARYVIAAYRQGLIAPEYLPGLAGDLAPLLPDGAPAWVELADWNGCDDSIVDRAAGEIGYDLTEHEEREQVTERLIYTALRSADPAVRRSTAERLGLVVDRPLDFEDVGFRSARVSSLRATLEGYFDATYGTCLDVGVHRHFADPIMRARHLIAAYERHRIGSAAVPGVAAEIVAALPGAGPAWTELAMASSATAWRSDLEPIVDRAATEIGHDRDGDVDILVEHELYRGLVDGDVVQRSGHIWEVDERSSFAVPWILVGHDGDIGIRQFFIDGAALLNGKYGSA